MIEKDAEITEDNLRDWYQGKKIPQAKEFHIFAVSAYIHSGVVLSLESTFPSDSYGWDTSHVGAVLVRKSEFKDKAAARQAALDKVTEWNDYLSGNVWGYSIENGDSCSGFYGDYDVPFGCLAEAYASVNWLVACNLKKHKDQLRAFIKNKVPLEKRTPCIA